MSETLNRIAIVGSRSFPENLRYLIRDYVSQLPPNSVIVSGGARGVDSWAVEEARRCGLQYVEYLPQKYDDNGKYRGPKAFFERNYDIIDDCDQVVAFWDGTSTGTKHSLDYAQKKGLTVIVYYTDGRIENLAEQNNKPAPRTFDDLPEKSYRPLVSWIKQKQKEIGN